MGILVLKMLKQALILFCILVLVHARPDLDQKWEDFKARYMKQYELGEEEARRAVWEDNHDFMENHNAAYEAGYETFSVGENEFNDLTNQEFVRMLNGLKMAEEPSGNPIFASKQNDLPSEVDWRTKGFVTPVKNQKQCGSCWAFSTTGSLEAAHFNKTGKLVSLSEQNLVDCSMKEGNHGCMGGLMDQAFRYIKENNGIDTEESYPYTAKTGKVCEFKSSDVGATLTSWVDIKKGSEDDLAAAVAQVGPISVGIDAAHPEFQMYKKGVYYNKKCSSMLLDHGVLVVGYGHVEKGDEDGKHKKFWTVKNSWGESWGNKGYINMARDANNMCGIATSASYPVV